MNNRACECLVLNEQQRPADVTFPSLEQSNFAILLLCTRSCTIVRSPSCTAGLINHDALLEGEFCPLRDSFLGGRDFLPNIGPPRFLAICGCKGGTTAFALKIHELLMKMLMNYFLASECNDAHI